MILFSPGFEGFGLFGRGGVAAGPIYHCFISVGILIVGYKTFKPLHAKFEGGASLARGCRCTVGRRLIVGR